MKKTKNSKNLFISQTMFYSGFRNKQKKDRSASYFLNSSIKKLMEDIAKK